MAEKASIKQTDKHKNSNLDKCDQHEADGVTKLCEDQRNLAWSRGGSIRERHPQGTREGRPGGEIGVEFGEGKANHLSKGPVVGSNLDHLKSPVWVELKYTTGGWGRSLERKAEAWPGGGSKAILAELCPHLKDVVKS